MRLHRISLCIGLALYIVSFLLPAVKISPDGSDPLRGWNCALLSLSAGWELLTEKEAADRLLGITLLTSGSVNVVFLIALVTLFRRKWRTTLVSLSAILIFMLCATPIALHLAQVRPVFGYFSWIASILLVLVANWLAPRPASTT